LDQTLRRSEDGKDDMRRHIGVLSPARCGA
jgi:hypothetical protein